MVNISALLMEYHDGWQFIKDSQHCKVLMENFEPFGEVVTLDAIKLMITADLAWLPFVDMSLGLGQRLENYW